MCQGTKRKNAVAQFIISPDDNSLNQKLGLVISTCIYNYFLFYTSV